LSKDNDQPRIPALKLVMAYNCLGPALGVSVDVGVSVGVGVSVDVDVV
jgi:hypothetical protein